MKRSKIFSVLLVVSALAAEAALASWFPFSRIGRQSRATRHPASDAAARRRLRDESQIHRVLGRPTGSIRPPVIVLQGREPAEAHTETDIDVHTLDGRKETLR